MEPPKIGDQIEMDANSNRVTAFAIGIGPRGLTGLVIILDNEEKISMILDKAQLTHLAKDLGETAQMVNFGPEWQHFPGEKEH